MCKYYVKILVLVPIYSPTLLPKFRKAERPIIVNLVALDKKFWVEKIAKKLFGAGDFFFRVHAGC